MKIKNPTEGNHLCQIGRYPNGFIQGWNQPLPAI